jgi:hypothetical protein
MSPAKQSVKLKLEAQRRRAMAPEYDPVLRDFELELADKMEQEAQALLIPEHPLQAGLGGEIIQPLKDGLPGLESALQKPDLLNLEAGVQRSSLIERAGVLELGIETVKDNRAVGSVQKMISHQMAAAHKRAINWHSYAGGEQQERALPHGGGSTATVRGGLQEREHHAQVHRAHAYPDRRS